MYCRALSHSNLTRRIPLDDASKCSFMVGTCVVVIVIHIVSSTVQRTRTSVQPNPGCQTVLTGLAAYACMARFGDASHVSVHVHMYLNTIGCG